MRWRFAIVLFTGTCLFFKAQTVFEYDDFLKHVLTVNPLSEKARNAKIYANEQFKAAKGNYDPLLQSNLENKYFDSKNYYTLASADIKQPLFASNYLKVGYQYGQGNFLDPKDNTPAYGQPFLGVETAIFQGLFFDKRRAAIVKSTYYRDYYSTEETIQLNNILFTASSGYVDYLYTLKLNSLYEYFASLAAQRLKGITELSNAGERASIDTIEASIFYQTRKLDQQSTKIDLIKKYADLQVLFQGDRATDQTKDFTTKDSIEMLYESFEKNVSKLVAAENSNPYIKQYTALQGVLETEARLKREMIKPILNVNYNLLSGFNNNPNLALSTNNYKWGATFSFPIFLRQSRHEYKMAKIDVNNNFLELNNKKNQVEFKRKYIIEGLALVLNQIANAQRASSYSNLMVEAEKLKFKNGESSLFLLNTRESKWLESEVKLLESKVKLVKLYLELVYLDGKLNYERELK